MFQCKTSKGILFRMLRFIVVVCAVVVCPSPREQAACHSVETVPEFDPEQNFPVGRSDFRFRQFALNFHVCVEGAWVAGEHLEITFLFCSSIVGDVI
eukprot:sb/3479000/